MQPTGRVAQCFPAAENLQYQRRWGIIAGTRRAMSSWGLRVGSRVRRKVMMDAQSMNREPSVQYYGFLHTSGSMDRR